MMSTNKSTGLKNFLICLAKGGTKLIPIVGGLLEEAIFGTLDKQAAAAESAKLNETLANIQDGIELHNEKVADLIERLRSPSNLNKEAQRVVTDVVLQLEDVENSDLTPWMEQTVRKYLSRHSVSPEELDADTEAVVQRLIAAASLPAESTRKPVNRITMVSILSKCSPANMGKLLAALEDSAAHVTARANVQTQVFELFQWSDGGGPSLEAIFSAAQQLEVLPADFR